MAGDENPVVTTCPLGGGSFFIPALPPHPSNLQQLHTFRTFDALAEAPCSFCCGCTELCCQNVPFDRLFRLEPFKMHNCFIDLVGFQNFYRDIPQEFLTYLRKSQEYS